MDKKFISFTEIAKTLAEINDVIRLSDGAGMTISAKLFDGYNPYGNDVVEFNVTISGNCKSIEIQPSCFSIFGLDTHSYAFSSAIMTPTKMNLSNNVMLTYGDLMRIEVDLRDTIIALSGTDNYKLLLTKSVIVLSYIEGETGIYAEVTRVDDLPCLNPNGQCKSDKMAQNPEAKFCPHCRLKLANSVMREFAVSKQLIRRQR